MTAGTAPRTGREQFHTGRDQLHAEPDHVVKILRWGIVFIVLCLVSLALYAVTAGVVSPPAPRTQAESVLMRAQAAVDANEKDGLAWAQLARAQYLMGKKDDAYETIARARTVVEADERPILWVNNQELEMVISDGNNERALEMAEAFIKTDAQIRVDERAAELSQGIDQSLEAQTTENQTSIELFLLQAQAETNLGRFDEAVEAYDNALLMAPMASDILVLRGSVKLSAGDIPGAKEDFQAALRYMPDLESAKAGLRAAESGSSGS